ncbi:MAG: zf-HC2 domain-containing protein [Actinomycetota bacterium]
MRCEAVELELSARLDGEADPQLDAAVTSHLETCADCTAFEAGAQQVRVATRVRSATPVPDLVHRIMAAIEAPSARLPRRVGWEPRRLLPYAAAFVSGGLVASLILGGLPVLRRGPSPALATEIPREVAAAAAQVTSYRATFSIEELNFSIEVPRRTFSADVRFRAPETFRAAVTDLTTYPGEGWTHNDFVLAVDSDRWSLDAPRTCPRETQPGCLTLGREVRSVVGRAPFEGDTALPTDIVLPVRTLVDVGRVDVVEETSLLGRDAVTVELAYNEATPLFSYLHSAGTWRPFFPQDRVLVTLDRKSWFPLAYEVRAASSVERSLWATRQGLPSEPPGMLLFRAEATDLGAGPGSGWRPSIPPDRAALSHGYVDEPPATIASSFGTEPPLPTNIAGLRPYASGLLGGRFVFAYARGLGWLTVSGSRDFIETDQLAMPVQVGEGVGLYSPATAEHGRRLALRDGRWDLVIETNLPRADLLSTASSVPIVGFEPSGEAQTIEEARDVLPSLLEPGPPPSGYRLWTVEAHPGEVTLRYLRPGSELDGTGIRLYQSRDTGLPPPLDLEVLGVTVRGLPGRYSAERSELEWVEDGVYRSLQAPAFDLAGLLRIAASLEPAA